MTRSEPVAGILIGGESRRMGQPKHLLRRGQATYLERIVRAVKPVISDVVLVGSGACPPALATLPRVEDAPEVAGPIGGILALLAYAAGRPAFVVGCDFPDLHPSAVRWLLDLAEPDIPLIMPRDDAGVPQPCFALYGAALRDPIRAEVAAGTLRAPRALARFPGALTPQIPPDLAAALTSVNTPDERATLPSLDDG